MRTYHEDYGISATITDRPDGTAHLIARDDTGKKVKDSTHASRKAAIAAWNRIRR